MRLWFRRTAPARSAQPAADPFLTEEVLRREIEGLLDVRERRLAGAVIAFRGHLLVAPAQAVDLLVERFRPWGYTPFLKADTDGVVLQAWPLTDTVERSRIGINVLLFLLTCASTLIAGLSFTGSPTFDALRESSSSLRFFAGLPFAFTLMAILGVHEFGHYFTARYHRASVSLPYFIPAPIGFGTLGAIIRMRSPARDRNSLFDIAAAGPLAGLAVALPAIVVGFGWSHVAPIPPGGAIVFGDSIVTGLLGLLRFGWIPEGSMLFTHPVADAAWAGFLVTALNLFPVGQLDGGRIAYALFGRHHRWIGKATVVALVAFGVGSALWSVLSGTGSPASALNWFVWAALVSFLVGFHHSPPLDDVTPLSRGRRRLGLFCLLLIVVLTPPFVVDVR